MILSISLTFNDGAVNKQDIVDAIRAAATRAADQIEFEIIQIPRIDDQINLGSPVDSCTEAVLFRPE